MATGFMTMGSGEDRHVVPVNVEVALSQLKPQLQRWEGEEDEEGEGDEAQE